MNVPLLRFGVVSDIHARLADDGKSLVPGLGVETFEKALKTFRDWGADAVVVAGDFTDSGLVRELEAVAKVWFRVFPDDRAPDGRKVERIFVLGNHDAYGLVNGHRVFADDATLRREAIETDPQGAWRRCFGEDYEPFFVKTVMGYDFFCAHWKPGVWCNGYAETGCAGCEEAFRAKMGACDPLRPFFYVQHPHPAGTVYGRCAWGVDDGEATRLLSRFQNAIAFSGHSHEPLTNEKSIWRGAFTSIATGSLQYVSANAVGNRAEGATAGYENGVCNWYEPGVTREERIARMTRYDAPKAMPVEVNAFDVRSGLFVTVYADRVEVVRREFLSGLDLGEPWRITITGRDAPTACAPDGRFVETSPPPQFPAGAALAAATIDAPTRGIDWHEIHIPPETRPSLRLDFPAATLGGHLIEYEISAECATGVYFTTRICAIGGLYPPEHPRFTGPERAIIPLDRFPARAKAVAVTPLDSFGRRGQPLVAAMPTMCGRSR